MKQTLVRLGMSRSIDVSDTTCQRLKQHEIVHLPPLTIASNESHIIQRDGDILLVIGSPLPAIEELPGSWQEASTIFAEKDGIFAAFFWDNDAHKLVVSTDFLGMQPLYWKQTQKEIVFSDKCSAFAGLPNLAGWGAFIAMGYTLGQDTLTDAVFRVEPATILVIDADTLAIEQHTYWAFSESQPEATVSEVFSALEQSVKMALNSTGDKTHTVLMSGGYDSRLIAYFLKRSQVEFSAIIVSHYNENLDADAKFAKNIVHHLGISYTVKTPDINFFSSAHYLDYLEMSDSEIPSLYLFISQVGQFVDGDIIWEGLLPGKTLPPDESNFSEFRKNHIKGFEHSAWRAAEQVFGHEVARMMWHAFEQRWACESGKFSNCGEGVALFNLAHRARNRVGINPYKIFQQHARVFTPGMTRAYIQAAMSVNHLRKLNYKLYQEIFARWFPTALQFPIVHGSTIDMMHSRKISFYLFRAAVAIDKIIKQHPSVLNALPLKPAKTFSNSRFLQLATLLSEENLRFPNGFECLIKAGNVVPENVKLLLFYFRVWQFIKASPLTSYFE